MVGFFIPVARAALLGLALVAAAAAQAQQPSPAALASARELMDLKGVKSLVEPVVSGVIQQTTGTILQTNPGLTKDLQEVSTQLRNEYQPRVAEMTNEIVQLYAQRFSEQELKELEQEAKQAEQAIKAEKRRRYRRADRDRDRQADEEA